MEPESFKKLKAVVTQLSHQFRLVDETSASGRPRKISRINAITLSLYQHKSTRATKKSVYEDFKETLKCSYKTLDRLYERVSPLVLEANFHHYATGEKTPASC